MRALFGRRVRGVSRTAAWAGTFVAAAAILLAWIVTREAGVSLEILRVYDVSTPVIEVGADLEITGDGFAQGRRATVVFEGTLNRPGREPDNVTVETRALALSRDRLLARVDRAFERALAGPNGGGHATFHGDVIVAFTSEVFGHSRLTGRLRNVTLDVRSPVREADQRALQDALARFQRVAGFTTHFDDTLRELTVAHVDEGSRAARAGLSEGDVLARVAGVRVFDATDAAPAPLDRVPLVVLRGEPQSEVTLTVDARGYAQTWPREAWTALFVFLALAVAYAVAALAYAPSPAWVRALVADVHGRVTRATPSSLLTRDAATFTLTWGAGVLFVALAAARVDVVLVTGVDGVLFGATLLSRRVPWAHRGAAVGFLARAFAVTALVTATGAATLGELAASSMRSPLTDFSSVGVLVALAAWILGGAMLSGAVHAAHARTLATPVSWHMWLAFDAVATTTLFVLPLPEGRDSSLSLLASLAAFGAVSALVCAVRASMVRGLGAALGTWAARGRVMLVGIGGMTLAAVESRAPYATWRVVATHTCVALACLGLVVLGARILKEVWHRSQRSPIW